MWELIVVPVCVAALIVLAAMALSSGISEDDDDY